MSPNETKPRRYSLFAKSLKSCIEPVTKPILKSQGLAGNRILEEWEQIVGSQLATHTLPEKLTFPQGKKTDGTLVIGCESAHALALQHMQPIILERLAVYFGYRAVGRITISQRFVRPVVPAQKKSTIKAVMVDDDCLSEVEDVELKQALAGFAKTIAAPDK